MIKVNTCDYDPDTDQTTITFADHDVNYLFDITPTMTANNAPSPFVANASTTYSGWDPFRAFNNSLANNGWSASGNNPQWLSIDLGASYIVDCYRMAQRTDITGYMPTTWTFQGSTDNSNWINLDSRANIPEPSLGTWGPYFFFLNTTPYRYYRIYITANVTGFNPSIGEVEIINSRQGGFVTANDQFNNYRAVKIALDGSDGFVSTITDTVDGTIDSITFSGSHIVPDERNASGYCTDTTNNILYLFGGAIFSQLPGFSPTASGTTGDSVYYANDVWKYDLASKKWTKVITSGTPPVGRAYSTLVFDPVNNALWLFGGNNSAGTFLNDLWKLTLSNNTWTQMSPTGGPPAIRTAHAACYDVPSQCMYILTGQGSSYLNDVWRYSIPNNTWTQMTVAGTAPSVRGYCGYGVTSSREVYLFGGYDGSTNYNTLYKYSIPGNAWSSLSPPSAPSGRRGSPLIYSPSNNCFYMQGGCVLGTSPNSSDFWVYSITNNTWTQLSSSTGPNYSYVGVYYNNKIVNTLGHAAWYRKLRSDTWEYDIAAGVWSRVNCGLELKKGDFIQIVPPDNVPCLYLGCIRIDSSGNLQKFIKRGWVYRWYSGIAVSSYKATGGSGWPDSIGTYSGNTYVGAAVPPQAISAYFGTLVGDYGSQNTSGPVSMLYSDEGVLQVYNEYNWEYTVSWKVFETLVNWTFCSVQSVRNQHQSHQYGTMYIPQDAYFRFFGFEE
jgi:hypothetical protein